MAAKCSVCSKPLDVHQQVRGGTCDDGSCRTAAVKRWIAQQHAGREAVRASVASAHLQTLLADRQRPETDVAMVVVSAAATSLESVSATRREALRESIVRAVAASEELKSDVAPAQIPAQIPAEIPAQLPAESPTAGAAPASAAIAAACATCRGFCCRAGGDSAYIDASTVRRVRLQRPDLSPGELVALYVDAAPERSVERSCIFHGEHGCALARELRSHTCNSYFCGPMREWIGRPAATPAPLTAVIVLDEDRVVRSALIG